MIFFEFADCIISESKESDVLNNYAASFFKNKMELYHNPLTGSLLVDSTFTELESKLKSMNSVCELTIGANCENLIEKNEDKLAYILKTLIDIEKKVKENSYVVISIRNKSMRLFISINMRCKHEIHTNRALNKLVNYIRIDKGICMVDDNKNETAVDILLNNDNGEK